VVLGQFLADKAPHVKLTIHRDRDYMSAEASQKFEDRLKKANILPMLTEGADIESYFLCASHIHALNPSLIEGRIQQLIDQATSDTETKSIEAMVNLRTEEAFRNRQMGGGPPNHGQTPVTTKPTRPSTGEGK
jgi:hypothetical protein